MKLTLKRPLPGQNRRQHKKQRNPRHTTRLQKVAIDPPLGRRATRLVLFFIQRRVLEHDLAVTGGLDGIPCAGRRLGRSDAGEQRLVKPAVGEELIVGTPVSDQAVRDDKDGVEAWQKLC